MAYASRAYRHNFTGGYGRGSGQGGDRRGNVRRGNPEPRVDMEKLLENLERTPIKTWTVKSIADLVRDSPNRPYQISNRRRIASFNWGKTGEEIVVPGAPKQFYEWKGGNLRGHFDETRIVPEERILDAMVTAVRIMEPSFKLTNFDIVSDMEALRAMFHICLRTMNTIRADQVPIGESKPGINERPLRIDVQMVGNTLLLRRQEVEPEPSAGVGLEYRRICSKSAPKSMILGEQLDDGDLNGQFRLIMGITMGNVRILLANEIDAARYPEDVVRGKEYRGAEDVDMEVEIGGFKGNLDDLMPISFASRSINANSLHPSKWLTQYLVGIPYRYLGLHDRGKFVNPPSLIPMDQIRERCGFLEQASADLWVKVLERVLHEIVLFARQNEIGPKFAIVITPSDDSDRANVAIHRVDGKRTQVMISEGTLDYLMKTVK